ncbi:hypothetical protein CFP56_024060 [Quercus suber]|uniref:Uncharacterized protein n=1 Tax=Quercus suber TaxID=58331 RepID=A0AAW0K7C7_QUESU
MFWEASDTHCSHQLMTKSVTQEAKDYPGYLQCSCGFLSKSFPRKTSLGILFCPLLIRGSSTYFGQQSPTMII